MKIAIADDHNLVRNGIADLLRHEGLEVDFLASNGKEMLDYAIDNNPDVVLMDINMPLMDGWEATEALKKECPNVKVIALSVLDDDLSVIRMLRAGARGYLLKDSEPKELVKAINTVYDSGYYHTDFVSSRLMKVVTGGEANGEIHAMDALTDREMEFLKFTCSELTYKEIADKMFLSPRTIDGYRDSLFNKLNIKSRVGLVLYAIKHRIVEV